MSDKNRENDSSESDQTEEQHAQFNRPRRDATLMINTGSPALYQLNTERKFVDRTNKKVRQWTYGRRDRKKQNKVILLVGETGSGKTTIINTMINYVLGVKFEDKEFYQITHEGLQNQIYSQTAEINVYEVFVEENPTSLTIIDTPGYAHTEGFEKDKEIAEYLFRLFTDEDDGIDYIDAVCFVMKASQNRLFGKEHYVFHSVQSLFGRDIENNIVFLLTYSGGGRPTNALNAIEQAEIPCRRDEDNQPVHFLFDNQQKEKRGKKYDRDLKSAWERGEESLNEFFTLLEENNRKSVEMTIDVLKERSQLEACVSNLKERITEKELKMKELNQIQEALKQNSEEIQKCKNFQFTVNRVFKEKVPIKHLLWNTKATCCSTCKENCHSEWGCWWVSPDDLSNCRVMDDNGNCTVCTEKCSHSKHIKENKKYVSKMVEVKMSFAELKQEYENTDKKPEARFDKEKYDITKKEHELNLEANQDITNMEKILNNDLEKNKKDKSSLLDKAYITIMNLCNIALKPDSAFTLRHLDFLIPRLKEEKGKEEWVKNLEDLKKTGEMEKNKGALRHMADYTGQKWNQFKGFVAGKN